MIAPHVKGNVNMKKTYAQVRMSAYRDMSFIRTSGKINNSRCSITFPPHIRDTIIKTITGKMSKDRWRSQYSQL